MYLKKKKKKKTSLFILIVFLINLSGIINKKIFFKIITETDLFHDKITKLINYTNKSLLNFEVEERL